ncbi:MAG: linear amide C-N hydrolase [Paracoccaceae bacterium]
MFSKLAAAVALTAALSAPVAEACTRVTYLGPEGRVLTGRSMDWSMPMLSNLWAFPRGMKRDGAAGGQSLEWTSKYGSVIVSGYDIATTDGMNEKGLVANLLWLMESQYPAEDGKTPRMSLAIWAQFFLDNFATVDEAVAYLDAHPFDVATKDVPDMPGKLTTVHLSLSDATGDSAILEWIGGRLQIHHGRDYRVMTNDPPYDRQLAIAEYWKGANPRETLPGSNRAADRFVRAGTYIDMVEQSADPRIAVAATFSVIRNTSAPFGISVPGFPNLSTTRWRVVADQKSLVYYVESAISPNTFWVDLTKVDFAEGSGARVLDLGIDMAKIRSGEVSGQFTTAEPFVFEPAE